MNQRPTNTHNFIIPVLDSALQQYIKYLRQEGRTWDNIAESLEIIVEDNIEYLKENISR